METGQEGTVPDRFVSDPGESPPELLASRNHYRRVIQALSEGVFVQDRTGKILSVNRAAATILGLDVTDLAGRSTAGMAWDIVDEHGIAVAADDRPGRRCIETGEPTIGEVFGMRGPSQALKWIEIDARPLLRRGDDEPYAVVSTVRDVTARRAAEDSVRIQSDLLDAAGQAIIGTDRLGCVSFWNKAATRMYGWTRDEAVGQYVLDVIPAIDSDAQIDEITACIARNETWTGDVWIQCKDRTLLQVFTTTTPMLDAAGDLVACVGVSTDITERKLAESELARLALHDPLTDLPNRLLLVTRLDELLSRRELHGDAVVVLFIDLDRFKVINDGIGHQTGDEVLRAAAQRLAVAFPDEFIARFGGDEFVLLHTAPNRIDTDVLAARIHAVFERPIAVNGYELFLTASVGVAHATDDDTSETLLRDADSAMYEAKDYGRSRTTVFDETLRERATRRLDWENSLRHALDRTEFRLVYQPVVALADCAPVGFEALLRWDHPRLGSVSPADFIPVAEDTGSIVEIGAWVIDEAVGQLARWDRELGIVNLWMTVNVSTRQLATASLVGTIRAALTESGIEPSRLHLEITETALLLDDDRSIKTLRALRDMGVRLAIDDFGTGYSSLTYLKQLPIDVLKIDRSFVDGLGTDPNDTSIVRMILSLASALDLTAIAEGVETELQLDALREYGCELGQGYLWTPGLPPEQLVAWLDRTPAHARHR
jgi:diguanylate cyclase (GGDEF)-like protein/PAS domain S-box-containing protein